MLEAVTVKRLWMTTPDPTVVKRNTDFGTHQGWEIKLSKAVDGRSSIQPLLVILHQEPLVFAPRSSCECERRFWYAIRRAGAA